MNLILAIVWLVGAAVLFAYERQTGNPWLRIRGTDLSLGWLLLVLGLYNLARWVSIRSGQAARRAMQQAQDQRQQPARFRQRREQPPDPTFDFTNEPPPTGDRPPSNP
jgi:hypothetical protein